MDLYRGFSSPSKFAQEFLLFTDGLGHLKSKDFLIDRKSFNNNLVMYVLSGKLHVEQNGHFILQKNEGIIMRLTDRHKYYTDEIDTCEILWLHFSGRQSEIFMKYMEQNYMLPSIFKETRVAELIRQCFTFYKDRNSETEFLTSQNIYAIILTILHSIGKENKRLHMNPETEFIADAITYVDNNLYNKITLKEFAGQFNMSPYHFCRVFEKHFNITPMKFVLLKKIDISKYMLTYTHDSIAAIAGNLGFADQSHFSKTFKGFLGKSPLEFRREG